MGGAGDLTGWVLWFVYPGYSGPVLVRGRQLDGPNELRFERGQFSRHAS